MVRDSIKRKTLLAATAVALTMSGGAWAQSTSDTEKSAPTTQDMPVQPGGAMKGPAPAAPTAQGELPKSPPADQATAEPAPAPAPAVIAAQAEDQSLVSDVVGAKVTTPAGDDLGKIKDLIVGRDGKVEGAVLSVGGFLGIGDKEVALPFDALKQGGPDQLLVVAISKDQLEAAPDFLTLADQEAQEQAALSQSTGAVPAPAAGSQ